MGVTVLTTVVEPAAVPDLVTLADVKTELDLTGSSSDAWLAKVIRRASAAASGYCNRVFPLETVRDEFWPQRDGYPWLIPGGVAPLQLSRWPVGSITSVTENDVALSEPADYRLRVREGQLERLGADGYPRAWPAFRVVVEYAAGFAEIPDDVQDAVIRMVKARWFMRQRDPLLRQEEVPGVYSASYWVSTGTGGAITPDVSDLLDNYRVPVAFA